MNEDIKASLKLYSIFYILLSIACFGVYILDEHTATILFSITTITVPLLNILTILYIAFKKANHA